MNGQSDIVNYLLDNGADVNRVNNRGISILNACHHVFFCHHPRVRGGERGKGEGWGEGGGGEDRMKRGGRSNPNTIPCAIIGTSIAGPAAHVAP